MATHRSLRPPKAHVEKRTAGQAASQRRKKLNKVERIEPSMAKIREAEAYRERRPVPVHGRALSAFDDQKSPTRDPRPPAAHPSWSLGRL